MDFFSFEGRCQVSFPTVYFLIPNYYSYHQIHVMDNERPSQVLNLDMQVSSHYTRQAVKLYVPFCRTTQSQFSFIHRSSLRCNFFLVNKNFQKYIFVWTEVYSLYFIPHSFHSNSLFLGQSFILVFVLLFIYVFIYFTFYLNFWGGLLEQTILFYFILYYFIN